MARRKRHVKTKGRATSSEYWNKEYKTSAHLALSTEPSSDLEKFIRFLERHSGKKHLNETSSVLDLGCGNGRNIIYLSSTFNVKGIGYDISRQAIESAIARSNNLPIHYETRSISGEFRIPDESQSIVIDMMTSHFLRDTERRNLHLEISRVLKYDGWYYLKTFLRDEDRHAERLLKEYPGEEEGSYIHPEIGVAEHVFKEDELLNELEEFFTVVKVLKSHKHIVNGKANKRRSISIYAQKK